MKSQTKIFASGP